MAMTKEALTDLPVFDTRKYVQTLTREGSFNEKQANANADGLQEALRGVATKAETQAVKMELKADIREVKADIRRLEEKMDIQFQALKAELKAEIGALRKETMAEIGALRKETTAENQALRTEFQAMQEQMKGLRQLMVIGFSIMATMMATLMAVVAVSATLLLGAAP